MTFSLVGWCRRTGMIGAAVTTSGIGVGSRCPFARAGVGAVLTQHRTDPRIGPRALDLLASGLGAADAVAQLVETDPDIEWRQVAVIDATGATAFHHGARIASVHGAGEGEGCCAIGNILRDPGVPRAMADAFETAPGSHLADRLLHALQAGLAAGGEVRPLASAALLVVHRESFPLVDLRVELDPRPIDQLAFLWELYRPQAELYVRRAVDPQSIPYPEVT
ncbi:MAG: DUF1028 domain-containing protein [Ectothiorhodospiraceae bacterium]|nr:DUF1028 domain-containing protein [Ectothiorhodospiraceae bacterium]